METGNIESIEGTLAVSKRNNFRSKHNVLMSGSSIKSSNKDGVMKTINVRSYRCKQIGHYRSERSNNSKFNKNEGRKQTNAFSAVFLNFQQKRLVY